MLMLNVLSRFCPGIFAFFAAAGLGMLSPPDNPSISLTSFAVAMVTAKMGDLGISWRKVKSRELWFPRDAEG
jgi:hypothetical protein